MFDEKIDPAITRFPSPIKMPILSKQERIDGIAMHMQHIMELLGVDLSHQSVANTPMRMAKMYVNEFFAGMETSEFPTISFFDEEHASENGQHSIVLTKCGFTSFCEHHFVPMVGFVCVGYLPTGKLLGLSKIHRVVRYFASRPQLQERLTSQIGDSLSILLDTPHIAVTSQAEHFCVKSRGVRDETGMTSASYFSGDFQTSPLWRQEFFHGVDRLLRTHS